MQRFYRSGVLLFVMLSCVGCDQATKSIAQLQLRGTPPMSFFHGVFRLEYVENPAAFLSFGAWMPAPVRYWFFTVFVALFLLILLCVTLGFSHRLSLVVGIGLALVVGGGLGNLFDRMTHAGLVIDFMNVGIGSLRTGIFNVADMAIMAGEGLILVMLSRPNGMQTERVQKESL
jgi:signal peptidase II